MCLKLYIIAILFNCSTLTNQKSLQDKKSHPSVNKLLGNINIEDILLQTSEKPKAFENEKWSLKDSNKLINVRKLLRDILQNYQPPKIRGRYEKSKVQDNDYNIYKSAWGVIKNNSAKGVLRVPEEIERRMCNITKMSWCPCNKKIKKSKCAAAHSLLRKGKVNMLANNDYTILEKLIDALAIVDRTHIKSIHNKKANLKNVLDVDSVINLSGKSGADRQPLQLYELSISPEKYIRYLLDNGNRYKMTKNTDAVVDSTHLDRFTNSFEGSSSDDETLRCNCGGRSKDDDDDDGDKTLRCGCGTRVGYNEHHDTLRCGCGGRSRDDDDDALRCHSCGDGSDDDDDYLRCGCGGRVIRSDANDFDIKEYVKAKVAENKGKEYINELGKLHLGMTKQQIIKDRQLLDLYYHSKQSTREFKSVFDDVVDYIKAVAYNKRLKILDNGSPKSLRKPAHLTPEQMKTALRLATLLSKYKITEKEMEKRVKRMLKNISIKRDTNNDTIQQTLDHVDNLVATKNGGTIDDADDFNSAVRNNKKLIGVLLKKLYKIVEKTSTDVDKDPSKQNHFHKYKSSMSIEPDSVLWDSGKILNENIFKNDNNKVNKNIFDRTGTIILDLDELLNINAPSKMARPDADDILDLQKALHTPKAVLLDMGKIQNEDYILNRRDGQRPDNYLRILLPKTKQLKERLGQPTHNE